MLRMMFVVLMVCVAACDQHKSHPKMQPSNDLWVEKVKLANGEVLTVEHESRYGQGEAGTYGGPLTYTRLEFDYKGKHYRWESEEIAPALLEIDGEGRPVIAGDVGYEWAWRQLGSPCDRVFVLVADGHGWKRIPSWEMTVSNRMNLAGNRRQAEAGISLAEDIRTPSPVINNSYYKEKCE